MPQIPNLSQDALEGLEEILSHQVSLISGAVELGEQQRSALVQNNFEKLKSVSGEQEVLGMEVEASEKKRLRVFSQIRAELLHYERNMKPAEQLKCNDFYPFMNKDQIETVSGLRNNLWRKLAKIRQLNETNAVLIHNSRKITQNTIEVLTGNESPNQKKQSQTYNPKGSKSSLQKPKRSLFNHKV